MAFFEKLWVSIDTKIKDFLTPAIEDSINHMFTMVNDAYSSAGKNVAIDVTNWSGGSAWSLIDNVAQLIIVPIASIILAYVLCFELYELMIKKNNQHIVETKELFQVIFRISIAKYIVTNAYKLIIIGFTVVNWMINQSMGLISSDSTLEKTDLAATIANMKSTMNFAQFAIAGVQCFMASYIIWGITIVISVVLYGRIIEIFVMTSVAAIPLATMFNKEMDIGKNYIKSVIALALQGFLIMFVLAIFARLATSITTSADIMETLSALILYSVVLGISVFKTSRWAKSILSVT
jgi:hypothetical protein